MQRPNNGSTPGYLDSQKVNIFAEVLLRDHLKRRNELLRYMLCDVDVVTVNMYLISVYFETSGSPEVLLLYPAFIPSLPPPTVSTSRSRRLGHPVDPALSEPACSK